MTQMTSHERFKRMFEHRPADRIPVLDSPWNSTIERWHREGMPKDADFADFFGLDHMPMIKVDKTPQFPVKVLEETEEYTIATTGYGVTLKNWKHSGGVPEFVDFTVVDPDVWAKAKKRMTPDPSRINWKHLEKNYPLWRQKDYWIAGGFWFGFDVTHSWMVGTERLLMALVEQPEWCVDMFETFLDMDIALFQMILDKGYTFDSIFWYDDLGFKGNQFMSVNMYRQLLKPTMKRAIDWAHDRGIRAHLHSCGDVNPFIPEFIEIGLDALNPLEVKAGMDPIAIKKKFGDKLVLHGGINAALWTDFDAFSEQMRRIIPAVKENGGYIFSSDHSVPDSVPLETFRKAVELAKELGRYD